jgi:hypothetical protein
MKEHYKEHVKVHETMSCNTCIACAHARKHARRHGETNLKHVTCRGHAAINAIADQSRLSRDPRTVALYQQYAENAPMLTRTVIDAQVVLMTGTPQVWVSKHDEIWLVYPAIMSPIDAGGEYFYRRWALIALSWEQREVVYSYFPPSPFAAWAYADESHTITTATFGRATYGGKNRFDHPLHVGRRYCPACLPGLWEED